MINLLPRIRVVCSVPLEMETQLIVKTICWLHICLSMFFYSPKLFSSDQLTAVLDSRLQICKLPLYCIET